MRAPEPLPGWAWLERPGGPPDPPAEVRRAAAAAFATANGAVIIRHLRRVFLDRRLPPSASDAELRHLEGQRSAVAHLLQLAEQGREAAAPPDERTDR